MSSRTKTAPHTLHPLPVCMEVDTKYFYDHDLQRLVSRPSILHASPHSIRYQNLHGVSVG